MRRTRIYVNFNGHNEHGEDTSQYVASFYVCAIDTPGFRLGNPLPSGYTLVDYIKSPFPGSVDLTIESPDRPDLAQIMEYIQHTFGGPTKKWNSEKYLFEEICPNTKVSVGQIGGVILPFSTESAAA